MNEIKVGCCGFCKGKSKYFEQFKLVEIEQTFYKPPLMTSAQKWREEAPENFEFSLKARRVITHLPSSPTYRKASLRVPTGKEGDYGFFKPSAEVFEAWEKTRDIARVLTAKAIVFQCPAKFAPKTENIANIERGAFSLAWEPRGEWREDAIAALCQELGLIHCVDPLESKAAHRLCTKYGVKYFRLHGGPGYRHQYSDEELATLAELSNGETYVLFNNIAMYEDALGFKKLIESDR
jgi:uncharacterized protein YecE (DUF72 family)